MTKQDYWKAHVAKNPRFADEENKIQMSVKMLRQLMEEAFDKGFEQSSKSNDFLKDLLGDLEILKKS